MSDLSSTSCCKNNRSDNGISPMFLIFILLFLGGGNNGFLGGLGGNSECGCNNGLSSILPLILLLSSTGGSF